MTVYILLYVILKPLIQGDTTDMLLTNEKFGLSLNEQNVYIFYLVSFVMAIFFIFICFTLTTAIHDENEDII